MAFILSLSIILCWSLTWLAIKLHISFVPLELSLFYRMAIASLVLFLWAFISKKKLRYSAQTHIFFVLQGFFSFCVNYLLSYMGAQYLLSGIGAVVFSVVLPLNMLNSSLFFGDKIDKQFAFISALSLVGLALVFWPELSTFDFSDRQIVGLIFSLLGALSASLGNMIATRNQRNDLPILQTNAFGTLYGALFCLLFVRFKGIEFSFDSNVQYWGPLLFLSIVGTVIAFGVFFKLIQLVGAAKAAYPLVLVPVVALLVSQAFEGFKWSNFSLVGIVLIVSANCMLLYRKNRRALKTI